MSTLSIAPARHSVAAPQAVRRTAVRAEAPAPASVRLTRRGRVVVTLLILAVALVVLTLFSGHSAATGESGATLPTRTVVVGEGDTLWGIAAELAAPGEIRDVVHDIEKLNSLPGPGLVEGQVLAVPVG